MKTYTPTRTVKALAAATLAALLLAACSSAPMRPMGADAARANLSQLQADPQLVSRAPVAIKDAEAAVVAAEVPQKDVEVGQHLVVIADRKVEIARAQAQSRLLEDQRKTLAEQREAARLEARTREADKARADANVAQRDANTARRDATAARTDANIARTDADISRVQADAARAEAEAAQLQADELQRQITELNARTTERGLVVTLGDVLFATGRAELRGGTPSNLAKLGAFLNKYPDRTVFIEGHTDSVGSEESNLRLSERRAGAVRSYLISQGVAANRITSSGLGKSTPVASNDSVSGRAQNRRVEVIIASAPVK